MNFLIIDDHKVFRHSFILFLRSLVDCIVDCDEAGNGIEGIEKLRNKKYDLIFLDINMPLMDGVQFYRIIKKEKLAVPTIILTQLDSRFLIQYLINEGIHSFLTKNASDVEIKEAIHAALSERVYFPESIKKIIELNKGVLDLPCIEFSDSEKRLIRFLKDGNTSKEISQKSGLTVKTIDTYRERLLTKTQTKNVAELISFSYRVGILN